MGKYVRYDVDGDGTIETDDEYESILWRVLRDDEEKVELITADALGTVDFAPEDITAARELYGEMLDLIVSECKRVTGMENNIRSVGRTMDGDDYYEEDWANLTEVGISTADNEEVYWLASEWSIENAGNTSYGLRTSQYPEPPSSVVPGTLLFAYLYTGQTYFSTATGREVRPILELEAGILDDTIGSGTTGDPIRIYR